MHQTNDKSEHNEPIELPFEQRRFDIGVWVYDHQVGILVTLGVYLVAAIVVLFGYITLKSTRKIDSIAVEMPTLAELQQHRDKLREAIEQIEEERAKIEEITNQVSNENVESSQSDQQPMNIQEMIDQASELQRQMEANRASYESGLAELAELRERTANQSTQADTTRKTRNDVKVQGNVTVSYSLINPIRHSTRLDVPAYLCQGGGEVKIMVTVERSGLVSAAKIIKSANDECIDQAALYAALRTEFDISRVAPLRHNGHITYTFVPQ